MSIMYCEKHDRRWDSDKLDDCPLCENEEWKQRLHNCEVACEYWRLLAEKKLNAVFAHPG